MKFEPGVSMTQENEMTISENEMLIECDEALDVSVASDFKALLQQAMVQGCPIVLDGSRVERIDCAALQLLSALFIEANESGFEVEWRNPTEALQYAADMTGLKETLHL
jgi:anti-anti-sigma factor